MQKGREKNRCSLKNRVKDRKSTRLNSSHLVISYAVFCLKKKHGACFFSVLFPESSLKFRVREFEHGTVGVVDYQKFLYTEELVGHYERSNDIICYDAARV